ncbi:unnamed protein product, partial [Polarella glacialis]
MELLTGMLHSYPTARWTLKRCLASPWFQDVDLSPDLSLDSPTPKAGVGGEELPSGSSGSSFPALQGRASSNSLPAAKATSPSTAEAALSS